MPVPPESEDEEILLLKVDQSVEERYPSVVALAWVRYWVTERLVVAMTEPPALVVKRADGMPVTARLVVVAPVARRSVAKKVVEVAEVRSVLPVRVVDASVADEVALSMPIVVLPMSAPALKVMTVVVAFEGNG